MIKDCMKNKPYFYIGLFAIPLFIFVVLLNKYSPEVSKAHEPYSSVIIAFEFVESPEQLKEIFFALNVPKDIEDLDTLNKIDFGFMIIYTLFLVCFIIKTKMLASKSIIYFGVFLAVVALIGDVLENMQLLAITKLYLSQEANQMYVPFIDRLKFFTWLKWDFIMLSLLFIATILFSRNRISKIFAALLCIPFVLKIVSLFKGPVYQEFFALSIFFGFFVLIIYCFFYTQNTEIDRKA